MPDSLNERWPPVYDANDLQRTIERLSSNPARLALEFYQRDVTDPRLCQGDVVLFPNSIPVFGEDGEPTLISDIRYWMVVSNSCDFDREIDWSQLVPILDITDHHRDIKKIEDAKKYRAVRSFYIPPWSAAVEDLHHIADFSRPVPVHKKALLNVARLEARLSRAGWMLLHSCLVRFLARDDGRFDEK